MTNIILNIFLISVICVIIIDGTDIIDTIKHTIWKFAFKNTKPYRDFQFKPFSCSLCMTWWTSLTYLIISHHITLPYIAFSLLAAYMTPVINTSLIFIKEFFAFVFELLFHLIDSQRIIKR